MSITCEGRTFSTFKLATAWAQMHANTVERAVVIAHGRKKATIKPHGAECPHCENHLSEDVLESLLYGKGAA
jgi:hypothetical protein